MDMATSTSKRGMDHITSAGEDVKGSNPSPPSGPNDDPGASTRSCNGRNTFPQAASDESTKTVDPSTSRHPPKPVIELDGLSRPSSGARARIKEGPDEAQQRRMKMCAAIRTLLECVGEDPDREGLQATPMRYADTLLFLTQGYQADVESIVNNALFDEGHNEMVVVKDIDVHSLCEHHLVPFSGKMHIGYVPDGTVIGLSKLPRIAEMFSRRLQIQERLTKEVAQFIMKVLNPQGVAVVMESSHLCMVMRGVEKTGTNTITSCVLGCFGDDVRTRKEFFGLVGVRKT